MDRKFANSDLKNPQYQFLSLPERTGNVKCRESLSYPLKNSKIWKMGLIAGQAAGLPPGMMEGPYLTYKIYIK